MSEDELRARIARLNELLNQLDEDGQWIAELMSQHYERLAQLAEDA